MSSADDFKILDETTTIIPHKPSSLPRSDVPDVIRGMSVLFNRNTSLEAGSFREGSLVASGRARPPGFREGGVSAGGASALALGGGGRRIRRRRGGAPRAPARASAREQEDEAEASSAKRA